MDHASIWPKDSSSHLCSFITVVGSSSSNDGRTFQKFDLFLSPTTAFSAPKINEDLQSEHIRQRMEQAAELTEAELAELIYDYFDKSLQLTPYTQLANLTGQPAISLPTHVTATGLPLGIQLLAARGREDLLFQVGEQFEQEGKFKLPESYR